MNRPRSNSGEFAIINPIELDGIKTSLLLDKKPVSVRLLSSIPAKPLVQTKLKRSGFFVYEEQTAA